MGNSCNIIACRRNRKTGKLTLRLSQLHKDLLDIGKSNKFFNRKKANKAFFLTHSNKFLKLYDSELIFDSEAEDAEPIIASLYEVMKDAIPEVTYGDVRDLLAKKFGEGVYSFEEARDRMISFNKEMLGAHTFMGTIRRQNDGKYKFEITYNAIEELQALMQTIADKNFIDIITKKLNNLGIGIEQSSSSSYSTERYNRLANGLLGIIKLLQGESLTSDLAKETGHAIIGTLGVDHPLVKRLITIAENNPDIINEILGDKEMLQLSTLSKEKKVRELVGHLVGKYLEDSKNIDNSSIGKSIKNLINRIIDYIKTKFSFSDREYKLALYDAKYIAYKIVKDFMGDNFTGTLDNALSTKETLNASSNALYAKLGEILQRLDILADRSKDWGFDAAKAYRDKFADLMSNYNKIGTKIKESQNIEALTDTDIHNLTIVQLVKATRFIINQVKEAQALLVIVRTDTNPLSGGRIKDNEICKIIRKNEVLYNEAVNLLSQFGYIKNAYTGELDVKDVIAQVEDSLRDVLAGVSTEYAAIKDVKEGYLQLILEAKKKLALRLLTKINGNQLIALELHVSMTGLTRIKRHKNQIINLEEELLKSSVDPPLDFFSRYITAMLDSPAIINLLLATAIEEKKHEANVLALQAKDRLFYLYQDLRHIGIKSTSIFMEVDDNGDYTGNIISERNWGQWEKKRKEDYKRWFDEWWNNNKDKFSLVSEAFNDARFLEAKGKFLKSWHNENSTELDTGDLNEEGEAIKCWAPAISTDDNTRGKTLYDGKLFNKLKYSTDRKDIDTYRWLQEYMSFKKLLDALLPEGATNRFGVRAPLFQGTFVNRLHGALGGKHTAKEHIKRVGNTAWGNFVVLTLAENPSDTEYGGEHDTYDEDDLMYGNTLIFSREHLNDLNSYRRVPLYGVKKLKDPYTVSTDLIHSTLAYAAMAYNYNCLENVIDEVEVLASLLGEQKVSSGYTINELLKKRKDPPGFYRRMSDYMEQLVYNVYCNTNHKKLYRTLHKALKLLTGYGSLYFLGFNTLSAITNALTGLWEMFKESLGDEDFSPKTFFDACGTYIAFYCLGLKNKTINWAGGTKGSDNESKDFMNLFLKRFDALNDNQREFRDYHIDTWGYQAMGRYSYTNISMFAYGITDHWMQSIAYIATAKHTKLINKDGEESSIWNAYTVENGELVLKKAKDGTDAEWKILDKNLKRLRELLLEDINNNTVSSTMEKAVYETNDDGSLKFDAFGNKILKDIYVPWDNKTETLFKTTCRGINNRLHGVYNSSDGGAFLGTILGPSFASLKKYAIGLIDRRFSKSRYDVRSKKYRQGSSVTIANLFVDYLFTYDKNVLIHMKEDEKLRYQLAKRAANFVLGFGLFTYIILSAGAGMSNILRDRGYSENQIANIRRFWGDNALPEFLKILLYIVAPPDEQDKTLGSFIIKLLRKLGIIKERKNSDYDEDPWLPEISDAMLGGYIGALKIMRHMPFVPKSLTEDDEKILTKEYFYDLAEKYTGTVPFSIKGILQYQLYRSLLEQQAYNLDLYSLYNEYKNLTNSSLMNLSALYDTVTLLTQLMEYKTEEEIDALAEKKGRSVYDKYPENVGLEIYTRGINKGFKKGALHAIKVSPLRTGATWVYGYQAKKNQVFWRARALGLEEKDED